MNSSHAFALAVSLSLVAARASADPLTPAQREARIRFEEGKKFAKQGRAEDARIAFQQSYSLDPGPGALYNLAFAERNTHHPLEALQHFRAFMADPGSKTPDVQKSLSELPPIIDGLMRQTAHFTVDGAEPALVNLDGAPLFNASHAGTTYDTLPGHHVLKAAVGGVAQARELDLDAGTTVAVVFQSGAPPTSPPSPAPVAVAPSAPVETAPASTAPESSETGGGSHARTWLTVGLGAAAVAALGVGVGFGVAANSEKNTINGLRGSPSCASNCAAVQQDIASQRQDGHVANAMYIGAGVLGVAALGVLTSIFVSPEGHPTDQAIVAPFIRPGGGGFALDGHF